MLRPLLEAMTERHVLYANAIAERINAILKQKFLSEKLNHMKKVFKEIAKVYNDIRHIIRVQIMRLNYALTA